jgi:RNA polymerase sigma-70 factor (ECF subfamily)
LNETQEETLVRRCQAGDANAFRMLVDQHRGVLFGTAYLMMRDRGMAEDVVQEALIQIWRHLPSFRLKSSVKTWMLRIVVNEVKQQFRKKRVPTVLFERAAEEVNHLNGADAAIIGGEERQQLRQALETLPAEQRNVMVLRYFSELTVPEIARVLGEHEGTVKSRLSRGLGRLREILRKDEEREVGR